jgi:molybdopterin synthase catalytic subunit
MFIKRDLNIVNNIQIIILSGKQKFKQTFPEECKYFFKKGETLFTMELEALIKEIKKNKEIGKAGMILTHTGLVRETSREGRQVEKLKIDPDFNIIEKIVEKNKKRKGIIDIKYYMHDKGILSVGDELMHIVVAGDIRENTIEALTETLNEIKKSAVVKEHIFI